MHAGWAKDYFALQSFLAKKGPWSDGKDAEPGGMGAFFPRGPGRVPNQPLEHSQIIKKPAAANFREPATGVRSVALVAFPDFDQPGLLEHPEMAAEIAIGESAEQLEIGESQSLGMRHERGH